jgi:CheY-specific phosphatase CheX
LILLVDSDVERRKKIREALLLSDATYKTIEAKDYNEAGIKCANQEFNAIIGDALPANHPTLLEFYLYATAQKKFKIKPEYLCYSDSATFVLSPELMGKIFYIGKLTDAGPLTKHLKTRWAVSTPAVDVTFINPFLESTLNWVHKDSPPFAKKQKTYLKKEEKGMTGDLSIIAGISSSSLRGSIALSFQSSAFLPLASRVLGDPKSAMDDDTDAAAGEMIDQIFTMALIHFKDKGHQLTFSPPKIMRGTNHQIQHVIKGLCIGVTYQIGDAWFLIETILQTLNPETKDT